MFIKKRKTPHQTDSYELKEPTIMEQVVAEHDSENIEEITTVHDRELDPTTAYKKFIDQPKQRLHDIKILIYNSCTSSLFHIGNIQRVVVVLITATLAIAVPNFSIALSIIGAVVGTLFGFILPCIFHLAVFKRELRWFVIVKDILIILSGVATGIFATYLAIQTAASSKEIKIFKTNIGSIL